MPEFVRDSFRTKLNASVEEIQTCLGVGFDDYTSEKLSTTRTPEVGSRVARRRLNEFVEQGCDRRGSCA